MYTAKVKQKGQVTIPAQLRLKMQIREGTILEMIEESDSIRIRPLPPLKPGKVVGRREHQKIIHELDRLREHWR